MIQPSGPLRPPRLLPVSKIKIKFADRGQRINGILKDTGRDTANIQIYSPLFYESNKYHKHHAIRKEFLF